MSEATPQAGGTLRVALPADIEGFDVRKATDNPTLSVIQLIFESLNRLEVDQTLKPALATSWEAAADASSYTFHLRQGVKFHDDSPFTSDDVKFTFDSMLDPKFVSAKAGSFNMIDSIESPDAKRSVFKMKFPYADFLLQMSQMGIIPKAYTQKIGDKEFNLKPVGTGPFAYKEWVPDTRVVINKNASYWNQSLPYLDSIVYSPITDDSVRINSFKAGEIDLFQRNVPAEQVKALQSNADYVLKFKPFIYYTYISLDAKRVPAFKDKRVRQAASYAIDRKTIANVIGYGQSGRGPISPESPYFDTSLPYYSYDPDKAKQLLQEAGHKPGEVKFTFQTFTYPDYQKVGELAADMLKKAGFDVTLKVDDWSIVRTKCYPPQFQCDVFDSATGSLTPDGAMYDVFHTDGASNVSQYSNPQVNKLLEQARKIIDDKQRKSLYAQALKIVLDDSPFIFVMDQAIPALYWRYVRGFEINPWYSYQQLDRTWVDQKLMSQLTG